MVRLIRTTLVLLRHRIAITLSVAAGRTLRLHFIFCLRLTSGTLQVSHNPTRDIVSLAQSSRRDVETAQLGRVHLPQLGSNEALWCRLRLQIGCEHLGGCGNLVHDSYLVRSTVARVSDDNISGRPRRQRLSRRHLNRTIEVYHYIAATESIFVCSLERSIVILNDGIGASTVSLDPLTVINLGKTSAACFSRLICISTVTVLG